MRLVRLKVEHFGPVRYARLELGPGLNVLYGPNDLGKSTLATAVRTVLLVPASSNATDRWIEWQGDEAPRVELDFQTEERRFWRVKKTFGRGSRGTATLEASRDGTNFSTEARGRQVDGMLRQILRWGIPSPGGRGAPRGEPETFLTAALLARQEDVDAVFARGLADDPDESGREQLTDALQALGQDPLLKEVMETAEKRVDEVFTPKGGKKKGRGSPLVLAAEKILEAERTVADLRAQAEETRALEERLETLHATQLERSAAVEEARARLGGVELSSRREAAVEKLAAIDAELGTVAEAESQEAELARSLAEKAARAETAAAQLESARRARDEAAEALRRASDDEAGARRRLELEKAEKRELELRAAREDAERRARKARAAVALAADAERVGAETEKLRQELASLDAEEREAARALERSDLVDRAVRCREAEAELRAATEKAERVEKLRREARARREEAASVRSGLEEGRLPSADELVDLRRLREDLRVAEARLEVGLSVTLKPKRRVGVRFSRDGEEMQEETLSSFQVTLEAERQLRLEVEDLLDVRVQGGSQELREQIDALRARWKSLAAPWLEKTGVATVEELDAACRGAGEKAQRAVELEQEAASLLAQAEALGEDAGRREELERRVEKLREALGGEDLDALEAEARGRQGDREAMGRRLEEVRETRQERRVALAGRESRLESLRGELEEARSAFEGAPEDVLAEAEARLQTLDRDAAAVTETLLALRSEGPASSVELEEKLRAAEAAVASAEEALAAAGAERDAVQQGLERLRGELGVRRERTAGLDREAAARELQAIVEAMAGSEAEEAVDVEAARQRLEREEASLLEVEAQIREEEGALKQVGGDVVRERLERAEEALAQHREREAELELDYAAWRMLLQELREAESEQASHLGQALVEPVSERFRELTRGRYAGLELGPGLETQGVRAAGGTYGVDALSVGTRHHLSTLFRLAVAEQLGTAVVLDDQLVQSDVKTMAYFQKLLKEKAGTFQIVVLTCRPGEYLEPGEMPGRGESSERDTAEGYVRAVDLERLVARSGRPSG